jgi:hypothetical protein
MMSEVRKSIALIKSFQSEDALLMIAKTALIESMICKLEKRI